MESIKTKDAFKECWKVTFCSWNCVRRCIIICKRREADYLSFTKLKWHCSWEDGKYQNKGCIQRLCVLATQFKEKDLTFLPWKLLPLILALLALQIHYKLHHGLHKKDVYLPWQQLVKEGEQGKCQKEHNSRHNVTCLWQSYLMQPISLKRVFESWILYS